MIRFLKSWCEGIIVAVILSMIIESILPEGNHKKYVKVVIGIYIIFTILNPFLGKLNTNMEFSNFLNIPTVETSSVNTKDIQKLYADGIEQTLKNSIQEEFNCIVKTIQITYDKNYENFEKVELEIQENNISKVETVEIGNKVQNEENLIHEEDIKNYISENYNLNKNKIFIY